MLRIPPGRQLTPLLIAIFAVGAGVGALVVALSNQGPTRRIVVKHIVAAAPAAKTTPSTHSSIAPSTTTNGGSRPAAGARSRRPVTVGIAMLHLVDPTRTLSVAGRSTARAFDTLIRYPIGLRGPFPLIVFGHGYAVTPAPYSSLLDAWARAGYVVAAPIFPLENAHAPGGPDERDLVNQPGDMTLVISSLQTPATPEAARIASLLDLRHIAVAGQSDGGDTALAVGYDPSVRDPRVTAAIILSGAEDPFAHRFAMPAGGPPLLAIQGTADVINPPDQTYAFFERASPPKYLLKLLGAGHQPPYTEPGPELTTVKHMTLAFLNHYLKGDSRAFPRYLANHSAGPGSVLVAAQ